jgi:hypothetical protein
MGEIGLTGRTQEHRRIRRIGRILLTIVGISSAIALYLIVLTRGAIL